jgi:cytochrome b561
MDTKDQLNPLTRWLHWLVAIVFILLTIIGIYMANAEVWDLYPIHKSVGILLFAVILLRVIWRFKQGWPEAVSRYTKVEQTLSKAIHWILLLGTLAMPISGMLYSGLSGHGFDIFGWVLVDEIHDPNNPGQVLPRHEYLSAVNEKIHEVLGYALSFAIVLHVIGACKHHFVDKDKTLLRMLGK